MDVKEVKTKKHELAVKIKSLVEEFEKETDVKITKIGLDFTTEMRQFNISRNLISVVIGTEL